MQGPADRPYADLSRALCSTGALRRVSTQLSNRRRLSESDLAIGRLVERGRCPIPVKPPAASRSRLAAVAGAKSRLSGPRRSNLRASKDPAVPRLSFTAAYVDQLSVMAGAPLLVVAQNLGHADTRMVERHYGHLAQSFVADTIRRTAPTFGARDAEANVVPIATAG